MRIQHNIMAMNAYRNYNNNTSALSKNLEKLSSGYKINRAGDDAAGLAISEKMRAQITGLNAAQKNVKDGISLVKTAEGAMQEVQDMLNRMDYLATQSANGTYDNEVDRLNLQKEVDALKTEINRIADSANFNGIKLLDGSLGMNGEALKITNEAGTVTDTTAGQAITLDFSASNATDTHIQNGVSEALPKFSVDLGNLTIPATTANGVTVTLKIGTQTFTATATAANQTKGDFIDKLVDALNGSAAAKGIKVGSGASAAWFTASKSADGKSLDFTFMGVGATATAATKATGAVSSTVVSNFDSFIGQKVTISGTANPGGDITCDITNITRAVEAVDGTRAGISVTNIGSVVADGNELTIGDKTYVFKTKGTDSVVGSDIGSKVLIDVSTASGTAQIKEALAQLSRVSGSNAPTDFKISIGSSNKLHVDYTGSATNAVYPDYNSLKAIFSAKKSDTAQQLKTSTIEITSNDKLGMGNTVTIGTGSNATKYVFTDATGTITNAATAAVKYVQIGSTASKSAKNLAAAIGSNATANGGKVTIAANVGADAPKIDGGKNLTLQIGDTSESFNQMSVVIGDMHTTGMGIDNIDISNQQGAQDAISVVRNAINYVSGIRGDLGAVQNRLEHTQNNLSVMAENIQDAESTIRDTDVAEEMMSYVKNNILVQSAQAMLAQANQVPQGVLQLLG